MLKTLSTSLNTNQKSEQLNYNYIFMPLQGAVIGMLTGIVGAGGGFLIIPTLVIITRIDIKTAIGTSLVIVTLQSLIGFFLGDVQSMSIDWGFLLLFTSIAVVGIFIGSYLNHKNK